MPRARTPGVQAPGARGMAALEEMGDGMRAQAARGRRNRRGDHGAARLEQPRGGAHGGRRQRQPVGHRVLRVAVALTALLLVTATAGYGYLRYRFDQIQKVAVPDETVAADGQPFNMLVIGSDSRAGITGAAAQQFGSSTNTPGQRSDVVMVVHVDPATEQVSVLSIPRDLMVAIAGDTSVTGTYNRVNTAFGSGPDQLVETIQDDFGIPISHVVQVDFSGFQGAVDALGGVKLDFPYPAKDAYSDLDITQTGCQLVDGSQALATARSRHYQYEVDGYWEYDGTSDFGRIQRQDAFLRAMLDAAEAKYNPLTLNAFIGSAVHGLVVDDRFSLSDMVSLAQRFHSFSSSSMVTQTLPTYSVGSFEGYGDVLFLQEPEAQEMITQFLGGAPNQAITPPPTPSLEPVVVPAVTPAAPSPASSQEASSSGSSGSSGSSAGASASAGSSSGAAAAASSTPSFDPAPC